MALHHLSPRSWKAVSIGVFAFAGFSAVLYFSGFAASHAVLAASEPASSLWPINVDYPEDGSLFPPEITAPTFLWRDALGRSWSIEIDFADGAPALKLESPEVRSMSLGAIDAEAVGNKEYAARLTPQQEATHTWKPEEALWQTILRRSSGREATVILTGYNAAHVAVSQARMHLSTSTDPVGAPIFYRDVPLLPSQGADGVVQPLAEEAIHLIHWRIRDISKPESKTVLRDMPTCANCHSFSADGSTMGMDLDGPANDKGLYAVVPVREQMTIAAKDMVHWNNDGKAGVVRVGFMSQVSPDGRYVLSTFAGPGMKSMIDSYYVTNFLDHRFLQVFYPTRGILEYYDRASGLRKPLPGADDPKYVQTDGVWSRDGKWIVFSRAVARDPRPVGQHLALFANDPNETQIQYDLYRIPFNDGRGGAAERIVGASENGMSNNFPKISPDGKWVVFVQCKNGQLMRPDSRLFIVPFAGGEARLMRANTRLMNSWHSFSPSGRWLVFSSKARSPFTQMYLTHIDAQGHDTPAILVENTTAANRAVNIPEFVNIKGDAIDSIEVNVVAPKKQAEKDGN